jgi:predicted nucleic acid-binding protein
MYLLDTVVLSELRKRQPHAAVVEWFGKQEPSALYLSTISIGEIERGIDRQRGRNPAFAEALESWLDQLLGLYGDRILPVRVPIARRWGRLSARIGHPGIDLLIAATALENGCAIVTRNVRDFALTGVAIENPFEPR